MLLLVPAEELERDAEAFFDRKPPEVQARIYQLLVTDVAIASSGWGRARRYSIQPGWRLILTNQDTAATF